MKKTILVVFVLIALFGSAFIFKLSQEKKGMNTIQNISREQPIENTAMSPENSPAFLLEISEPTNNAVVSTALTSIKGKTMPSSALFINEIETVADAEGNFSVPFTLEQGENHMVIVANDAEGNHAEKELTVQYQ